MASGSRILASFAKLPSMYPSGCLVSSGLLRHHTHRMNIQTDKQAYTMSKAVQRQWVWPSQPRPSPPRCCECSASLSHQYYEKDGQLFCKKDYWARYGESCHGCSEHITKGLVMVSHLLLLAPPLAVSLHSLPATIPCTF